MRRLNTQDTAYAAGPTAAAKRAALPVAAIVVAGFLGLIAFGPRGDGAELVLSVQPSSSETVVSKFAAAQGGPAAEARAPVATQPQSQPEPQPVLAMAAAASAPEDQQEAQTEGGAPNLDGLSEVPPELIWKRSQEDDGKKETPKVSAAFSQAGEQLPWDEIEPVPFGTLPSDASAAQTQGQVPGAPAQQAALAAPQGSQPVGSGDVSTWVKSKVTEIKGASRGRPLFHFELWLEPPAEIKQRLVGVRYSFNTPAVRPQSMASSDRTNGFRISAGGLACADEIALTLRFDDGQSKTVSVDGCQLNS